MEMSELYELLTKKQDITELYYNGLNDNSEVKYLLYQDGDFYIISVDCLGRYGSFTGRSKNFPEGWEKTAFDMTANQIFFDNVKVKAMEDVCNELFADA